MKPLTLTRVHPSSEILEHFSVGRPRGRGDAGAQDGRCRSVLQEGAWLTSVASVSPSLTRDSRAAYLAGLLMPIRHLDQHLAVPSLCPCSL